MTHEEFYNAANKLVEGLNCHNVQANISITRHSFREEPYLAHTISFIFGDMGVWDKSSIMTQSTSDNLTALESWERALKWIENNRGNSIIKRTEPKDHIET